MRALIHLIAAISFLAAAPQASALAISPTDTATACNDVFRCGSPSISPGLTDDPFFGGHLEQRSAIEFSLAGLTHIDNAHLRLVATMFTGYPEIFVNDPILEIHGYAGDGTVQFEDLFVENLLLTTEPITELGVYTFDVTSFVAGLVATGVPYAGFAFRDIVLDSGVSFFTSNTLVVNVPEPEQVWLMMGGLLALLAKFRSKLPRRFYRGQKLLTTA